MHKLQSVSDKTAISLSMLCSLHCLVFPILVVSFPSVSVALLSDESFHFWMLFVVIPVSLLALTMGCKKHRDFTILLTGALGIVLLCMAALLGHELLGELNERILSVVGASIIALGHIFNYRKCKQKDSCGCDHKHLVTGG